MKVALLSLPTPACRARWASWLLAACMTVFTPSSQAVESAPLSSELFKHPSVAKAQSLLFTISTILAPLCYTEPRWDIGPGIRVVAVGEPSDAMRLARRKWLMEEFGAQPGEWVVLADIEKTPVALAGLMVGDVVGPLPYPTPEAGVFKVRRGTQQLELAYRAARSCPFALDLLESKFPYMDSELGMVQTTLPLLRSLDERELTIALAHEASQSALGHHSASNTAGQRVGRSLLSLLGPIGVLARIGENSELQRSEPETKLLIQADRLALVVLMGLGITPTEYKKFLRDMQQQPLTPGAPRYVTTRPVYSPRMEALDHAEAMFLKSGHVPIPALVAEEKLRATVALAMQAAGRQYAAIPAFARVEQDVPNANTATRTHKWVKPPATSWAEAEDVDRVPVREAGKPRYQHYLTLPAPKAFAIVGLGGWRFFGGDPDVMRRLLAWCAAQTLACGLYAVDDTVVWQHEEAKRISRVDQLVAAP